MDEQRKYELISIVVGLAIGLVASRRWKGMKYSLIAFVLVPQAVVMGYFGKWEAASIAIVLAVMSVMIDSLVAVRGKRKGSRHRRAR